MNPTTHKAIRYVITNFTADKFFAFGESTAKYPTFTTNAALAEQFPSLETARKVIQEGYSGKWNVITEDQLIFIALVSITAKVNADDMSIVYG